MTALSEAFAGALQHHQAGDGLKAEAVCRHILQQEPDHAPALHLLGILAQQTGRNDEALQLLFRAVVLCPDNVEFLYNLGVMQQLLGGKGEARRSYREILRLDPDHAGALNNLGQLALNLDALEEAEDYLRHALRVQADHGAAYHNLGLVCKRQGKLAEAISCFRQAVRLRPGDAAVHFLLGQSLEERDQSDEAIEAVRQSIHQQSLTKCRRLPSDEAVTAFSQAIRLQPDNAMFRCVLGNVLTSRRELDEALPQYEQAVRIDPDEPVYQSNLGNALTQLGRLQEAEFHCREAIRLKADFVDGHHNLANNLANQGRLEEALQRVEAALLLEPEHPDARHCRALWWLQQGRFAEGWPEYEWRWKLPNIVVRQCREPLWDGSALNGRTILLWAEQGLGDTLQAIRFSPLVKERGGTVVVECPTPLVRLLSRCAGIDRLVPRGSPSPAVDVQAPLMSLPWLLGTTLETIPADGPYLFADPGLVEKWRHELDGPPRFKIGIAWQGSPTHLQDRDRSIPLRHFAPVAHLSGVQLISLQKGFGREQLRKMAEPFPVTDLGPRLEDFADTAAVMENLDLVITCDTSVAHLAGALAKPVWLALPFVAEWRWLLEREDTPWYPSMRLLRQSRRDDWEGVFRLIAEELRCAVQASVPLQNTVSAAPREMFKNDYLHINAGLYSDPTNPNNVNAEEIESVEVSMTAFSEAFAAALQHHQAGEVRQAEEVCHYILEQEPDHAPALHLLGILAQQTGRNDESLQLLRRAVVLTPDEADFQYNLGVVSQNLGRKDEAMTCYHEATRLNPNHTGALNNLGQLALSLERLEEAETCLRRALKVQPDFWAAYHNVGLVCKRQGKLEEAISCYRQALRLRPDEGGINVDLGQALKERGQSDEAIAAFREAIRLQPDNAMFHCELANLLTLLHHLSEALPHYEKALRIAPSDPAHHSNMGNILTQLGRPQEAEAYCREAIRLQADSVAAHHNLANALAAQGRTDEAMRSLENALRLEPDHIGSRHCRALWWLQDGRFAEGWPEYEWRWKLPDMPRRKCVEPMWDGSPLKGRTILLWAEQGLGDTLQAIRFAPQIKASGGTVVMECQAPLAPLLSRCAGIDRLVPRGTPVPSADVQAPLMSLPWLLGITLENVSTIRTPYLFADPALVEQWRRELEGPPSLKIGIAWQGNPLYPGDRMRSIPLKHFAALASLPGVRLFSLQKGFGSEQLQSVAEQFCVVDLGCRLDESSGAFMDTAAVMQNLDLVVTSDTSVAHLAGGLGVPVWVALCLTCDWRFFHHREDNPWYPTMRLFRQKRFGDWDELFARMAKELASGERKPPDTSHRGAYPSRSPVDLARLWNRVLAHFQSGQLEAAEQLCRELLDSEPSHGQALNLLGVLAHQAGQNEVARQRLERAVTLSPQDAGLHYNLGVARQVLGQTAEAAASYRQTLRFQPDHPGALNNLGHALLALGQVTEAQQHLEQAVRLQPNSVDAIINLGEAYLRQGQLDKASEKLKQALQLAPDHVDSHNRLGLVARRQGRFDEAIAHHQEAVQLSPNFAAAHHNLGLALMGLGRYEEALASYEQAIRINPDHCEAHLARALIWLLLGDYEQGWRDYEYRWQYRPAPKPPGSQPLWDGSPLKGQTILLWAEQGLGDTIHFIRYAPLVKQQGGTVVVQCPAKLARLLSSCPWIDRLVPHNEPLPAYDMQAPLLSLPRILGTRLETVPADVPYLFADNDLLQRWQRELISLSGFRVGIAWQGDPAYRCDGDRSIPLRHFAPVAGVAGVRLISLQKGPGVEQLRELSGLFPVVDLGPRLDENDGAFMDTAAVMKCLDLIITSDTAVAHLAGALGVPVWLALTFAPEWRWLLDREDSPWYPSMRLFRQPQRGDWEAVFKRMAGELRRKVGTAASADVHVPIAPGELIDKITILEIKLERINDRAKLANVRAELAELTAARERCVPSTPQLVRLTSALKSVNETLWQIEDDLRECERSRDFGPRFVELARSVYRNNDRRAALKRQINELLGSRLIEEKSYVAY